MGSDPGESKNMTVMVEREERRQKARIQEPFLAKVRGTDVSGEDFEAHTLLDNSSAGGLYMRLAREVRCGSRLFIVIDFSTAATERGAHGSLAMRGEVLRSEPRADGLCGVAVRFTRHRLL
jgi:hypothetical protein